MKPYRLELFEKTGFRNITGDPVVIEDERGKTFYDTRNIDNRVWEFNLPKGRYIVARGRIAKRVEPVEFAKMALPPPERRKRGNPEHFEIVFDENPFKCTVDWIGKRIIYDNQFRDAELPILAFIYFHECGHRYYETEQHCDAFAYNKMIEHGYNPSQILLPVVETLSNRADVRKVDLVYNAFQNHFDQTMDAVDISQIEKFFIGDKKFTASTKATTVWDKPGGSNVLRTVPANETIGKIEKLNTAGTWGYLRTDQYNPKGGAVYLSDNMYTLYLGTEAPKSVPDAIGREVAPVLSNVTDSIFDFIQSSGILKILIMFLVIGGIVFYAMNKLQTV